MMTFATIVGTVANSKVKVRQTLKGLKEVVAQEGG